MLYLLGQIAILLGIVVLITVPLALRESKAKRRKIELAFAGRAPLDEQTFYRKHFMSRGVPEFIVSEVRKILEDELDADLSRLSSEDDFTKNLRFFFDYDSLASVKIVERLEAEFKVKISDTEAEKTHTVEDIVNLVWLKLGHRTAQ